MPDSPDRAGRGPAGRGIAATVRFRVTALATVAVTVVLVVAGAILVGAQRDQLTDNVDDGLREQADALAALAAAGELPDTLTLTGDDDDVAQVVASGGTVVASSARLEADPPMADAPGSGSAVRAADGLPYDDARHHIASRTVETPEGEEVTVHVAGKLDDVDEATRALTGALVIGIPVVAALFALLVWHLVGRTLRPVEAIRDEVSRIGADALHRRVPEPQGDDEIARLARTMNEMLGRVEDATARQRQFVADASHELRAPLARIRTDLEVDLAHPEAGDRAATEERVLREAVGMQHLVDDLLLLARGDATAPSDVGEPVDLDDIVRDEAGRLREAGTVRVDATGLQPVSVLADRHQLRRVVRNLADNAGRHASSTVTLTVAPDGATAILTVTDDGPGIPPGREEQIFERFARLDEARSVADGGAGLGLAIVRQLVSHNGGTVVVDPEYRGGARFVVTLPRAP